MMKQQKNIDWYYQRKGCGTCAKVDAYMQKHQLQVTETISASRKLQQADALGIAKKADYILTAKANTVLTFQFKPNQSRQEAIEHMLGPTGNLRSPLLIVGRTVLVGFDQAMFDSVFV